MLARQTVLLTEHAAKHAHPERASGVEGSLLAASRPSQLLSRQQSAPVSPLDATLMDLPASVANKGLTAWLNPLDATLTKNRGYILQAKSFFPPRRSQCSDVQTCRCANVSTCFRSMSRLPYTLPSSVSRKSFACHSYENTGGGGVFFPFWNSPAWPLFPPRVTDHKSPYFFPLPQLPAVNFPLFKYRIGRKPNDRPAPIGALQDGDAANPGRFLSRRAHIDSVESRYQAGQPCS